MVTETLCVGRGEIVVSIRPSTAGGSSTPAPVM
jgi:hypothetical protein